MVSRLNSTPRFHRNPRTIASSNESDSVSDVTFPTRTQVEQPIIWQMSRKFPDVSFDIRQASVQNEIGIMAVLLSGDEDEVNDAIAFLRSKGVTVEPIEKSVVEG